MRIPAIGNCVVQIHLAKDKQRYLERMNDLLLLVEGAVLLVIMDLEPQAAAVFELVVTHTRRGGRPGRMWAAVHG